MAADDPLIQKALDQIVAHSTEALRLKVWVNQADKLADQPPRFPEAEMQTVSFDFSMPISTGAARKKWNPGAFFNTPLSSAVRRILEARADAAGGNPSPASVDEIHVALCDGSFNFDSTGAEAQKNGIRISLGKNSVAFVKLPNSDLFGLVEWYGARPKKPGPKKPNGVPATGAPGVVEGTAAGDAAAEQQQADEMEGRDRQ